jgi:hypothetical protein
VGVYPGGSSTISVVAPESDEVSKRMPLSSCRRTTGGERRYPPLPWLMRWSSESGELAVRLCCALREAVVTEYSVNGLTSPATTIWSGLIGVAASRSWRLRFRRKTYRATRSVSRRSPPTTPPTMGPVFDRLDKTGNAVTAEGPETDVLEGREVVLVT